MIHNLDFENYILNALQKRKNELAPQVRGIVCVDIIPSKLMEGEDIVQATRLVGKRSTSHSVAPLIIAYEHMAFAIATEQPDYRGCLVTTCDGERVIMLFYSGNEALDEKVVLAGVEALQTFQVQVT